MESAYQKKNKFHLKSVPTMLDISVTKSTAMVAMQIVKILCKILAIKNHWRWAHTTTIVPIFIASSQCFDLASSYLIKKLVVNSEYSMNRQEFYPVFS